MLFSERDERYWRWKEAVKRSCGWEVHPDQRKTAGEDDTIDIPNLQI